MVTKHEKEVMEPGKLMGFEGHVSCRNTARVKYVKY